MRADELAATQFAITQDKAARLIMAGRVWADGQPVDKPGDALDEDVSLQLREKAKKYASRSGYKLEGALDRFSVDPAGLRVCDIGASNGGFTDCLLQRGAARVFAVDVAYGILDWRLREDERVTVRERTNARRLTVDQLDGAPCDMITADVSFISLTKIFPAMDAILSDTGCAVCLIKPQFEAPQKQLGRNGKVKDPAIIPELLLSIAAAAAENRLYMQGLMVSPIHGNNGNVEYLIHLTREAIAPPLDEDACRARAERALAEATPLYAAD